MPFNSVGKLCIFNIIFKMFIKFFGNLKIIYNYSSYKTMNNDYILEWYPKSAR